jgi:PatG Domain
MDEGDVPVEARERSAIGMHYPPPDTDPSATPAGCHCGRPGGRCVCGSGELATPDELGPVEYPAVYALGRVEPRFPTLAIEKEFAQATATISTEGRTDQQVLHDIVGRPEFRYLARQLCFVLTIQGLDTYVLRPRDSADMQSLVQAVRPEPSPTDQDLVIGVRGPVASPEACGGPMVPIVMFDQLYWFDRDSLVDAIPRPEGIAARQFKPAAAEVFDRLVQVVDNAGATPEHIALNYLAVRYPAVYARAAEEFARDFALTSVETRQSALGGVRSLIEVIFCYTNRNTDFTEKFITRVDVTLERPNGPVFPFLHTKLSPYVEH